MGKFGRRLVEQEYTLNKMVDEAVRVYSSLI